MGKIKDISGNRYGRLVALTRMPTQSVDKSFQWECICDCGNKMICCGSHLRSGHTTSCGCYKSAETHGMTKTRTYNSWSNMRRRCHSEYATGYSHYGGRGISVCDAWRNSFENFLQDMGERPPNKSLDRIDVNGNYTPENCRWVTSTDQARNKRISVKNKTGVLGVLRSKESGKYHANICIAGKQIFLGAYFKIEDAAEARKKGERMYWFQTDLNRLSKLLHSQSLAAGWWNDINTGEDMRSNVYFQASKLLLAHSELSEAVEALRKGLMDDKLPQYPGEAVELVDALIRIFEYCGMKEYDVDAILKAKADYNAQRSDHKVENRGKQGGKLF